MATVSNYGVFQGTIEVDFPYIQQADGSFVCYTCPTSDNIGQCKQGYFCDGTYTIKPCYFVESFVRGSDFTTQYANEAIRKYLNTVYGVSGSGVVNTVKIERMDNNSLTLLWDGKVCTGFRWTGKALIYAEGEGNTPDFLSNTRVLTGAISTYTPEGGWANNKTYTLCSSGNDVYSVDLLNFSIRWTGYEIADKIVKFPACKENTDSLYLGDVYTTTELTLTDIADNGYDLTFELNKELSTEFVLIGGFNAQRCKYSELINADGLFRLVGGLTIDGVLNPVSSTVSFVRNAQCGDCSSCVFYLSGTPSTYYGVMSSKLIADKAMVKFNHVPKGGFLLPVGGKVSTAVLLKGGSGGGFGGLPYP